MSRDKSQLSFVMEEIYLASISWDSARKYREESASGFHSSTPSGLAEFMNLTFSSLSTKVKSQILCEIIYIQNQLLNSNTIVIICLNLQKIQHKLTGTHAIHCILIHSSPASWQREQGNYMHHTKSCESGLWRWCDMCRTIFKGGYSYINIDRECAIQLYTLFERTKITMHYIIYIHYLYSYQLGVNRMIINPCKLCNLCHW